MMTSGYEMVGLSEGFTVEEDMADQMLIFTKSEAFRSVQSMINHRRIDLHKR